MIASHAAPQPDRQAAYQADVNRKEGRIHNALGEVGASRAFSGLTACPAVEGFRGRAHFSIEPAAPRPQLCGVDPRTGATPFEQSKWILPAFAQDLVGRVFQLILETDSFPAINGFDLRIAHGSKECHLSLTAQKASEARHEELCETLLQELPELVGVSVPSKSLALGAISLTHHLLGRGIAQHHAAFFQTNLHLTPALARAVQEALGGEPIPELIDLYCGVGLHSVLAADKAQRIVGADNHPAAIESARRNAGRAGIEDAAFHLQPSEVFARSHQPAPSATVILNPPRAGCFESVIRAAADWNPSRIINVSCHLETHIENLRLWSALGWEPTEIHAFDMFPFTRFVETVTLLERDQ